MHYVLFKCLVTRALHLEVCHDLSTKFLMAIRRFVSRRGNPDLILSESGKNIIVASQAITFDIQRNYQPDNKHIRLLLARLIIERIFKPPFAPHFVWESATDRKEES